MPSETHKIVGAVMMKCARAVARLPGEQLQKLFDGRAHLEVLVTEKESRDKKRCASGEIELPAAIPPERFPGLFDQFQSASSRQECLRLVTDAFAQKSDLFAFAKFLCLPVQKKDGQERIRDKIVEATAGERIDGEIIRGGY